MTMPRPPHHDEDPKHRMDREPIELLGVESVSDLSVPPVVSEFTK